MSQRMKQRSEKRKRRLGKPGSRPGDLMIDPAAPKPRISVFAYNEKELLELAEAELSDLSKYLGSQWITWVNVEGLGDKRVLVELGQLFDIHPLALEDLVNVPQRPKVEAYGEQVFLLVQLLSRDRRVELEQVGIYLGKRVVLTFQERPGDPFDPVRDRLRQSRGRLRHSGPDYLAYALLDAVIDRYFPVLEALQDHFEELETVLRSPADGAMERIQSARAELREARRAIVPLRDVTRALLSDAWPQITEETRVYLRDCRDHILEASELLDSCRDIASGLVDIHLSTVSHQANQTMKVLTVIATIFMPLSFLAGVYGMNFDPQVSKWNMPELSSPVGYPMLLLVMIGLGLGLAAVFWKKGWFK